MSTTRSGLDPVTTEVIASALPAISNEMTTTVQHSAYSQFIYEVKDYCNAIFDVDGRMMSQGLGGVAMFLADLGVVIDDGVRHFGKDGFRPGDVMIMNHQRVCGQHLNHINIYTPFFFDDELIGFPIVKAHHLDIGGVSIYGVSIDPWMEGFQIDQLKLYDEGVPNETAFQMIRDNVRMPEDTMGDLRAQIAACRLAERRLEDLFRRYGRDEVIESLKVIYDQSEARCRGVVEQIPDGIYEAESFLDNDKVDLDKPIHIKVKVIVEGSDMTIDLTGCSRQTRGMRNCRSLAGAFIAYKALTSPLEPVNHGSFRGLSVNIDEGNIMMATFPASYKTWGDVLPSVVDCVFAALAPAMPDRMPAGSQGIIAGAGFGFAGQLPPTNKPFRFLDGQGAGWGARPFEDGVSAMCAITQGDVRNSPVEALENKYPVRVERRGLAADSGGAGKFRGGLGLDLEATNLIDLYWNHDWTGRVKFPPQGLFGGQPGKGVRYFIRGPEEDKWEERPAIKSQWAPAGTSTLQYSSGGGGWGDPLQREPSRVRDDVLDGYVSADGAREEYGVVLGAHGEVDIEATAEMRRLLAENGGAGS